MTDKRGRIKGSAPPDLPAAVEGPRTEAGRQIVSALHTYHRVRERGNWIVSLDHPIGGNLGNCDGCDAVDTVLTIEAEARAEAAREALEPWEHWAADVTEAHEVQHGEGCDCPIAAAIYSERRLAAIEEASRG